MNAAFRHLATSRRSGTLTAAPMPKVTTHKKAYVKIFMTVKSVAAGASPLLLAVTVAFDVETDMPLINSAFFNCGLMINCGSISTALGVQAVAKVTA